LAQAILAQVNHGSWPPRGQQVIVMCMSRNALLLLGLLAYVMGDSVGDSEDSRNVTPEEQTIFTVIGLMALSSWTTLLALCLCGDCCAQRPLPTVQWEALSEAHRKPLTMADLESQFPLTRAEGDPMCVVCLSPIGADDPCRMTQCGHAFHSDCVLRWWMYRPGRGIHCPVCRQRQRPA